MRAARGWGVVSGVGVDGATVVRVVLVGFGVVGRSLAELVEDRRGRLYESFGLAPRIVAVADSRGVAMCRDGLRASDLLSAKLSGGTVGSMDRRGMGSVDVPRLIESLDADVVVETTPSDLSRPERAMEHLRAAFRSGKHAISVNKAPLAMALPGLLELASYNRVAFRFSGTVGAGTPVLSWARHCGMGDEILKVRAILNGTTNFMLWSMRERGQSFDEALAEAQRLGYAETDPTADVEGIDSAIKVVILANWVLGRSVTMSDVDREGIRGVTEDQIRGATERSESVKLIGEIDRARDGVLRVGPATVPMGGAMDVPECLNAVSLTLKHGGDVTLVGRGAGGEETAMSVLRDLVEIWHATEAG